MGDVRLRVIETPGNTQGGVCYYGEGVVFTGDTLFQGSIGCFDMPGGDGRRLIQGILARLMVLPADTKVYPGHGPDSTIAWERLTNPFLRGGMVQGGEPFDRSDFVETLDADGIGVGAQDERWGVDVE